MTLFSGIFPAFALSSMIPAKVLKGELEYAKFNKDSILTETDVPSDVNMKAAEEEIKLREEVAKIEKESGESKAKKNKGDKK
mgnify:CR=1 FL=1